MAGCVPGGNDSANSADEGVGEVPTLPPEDTAPDCVAGLTETEFGPANQYCGAARASVVVGGEEFSVAGGSCERTDVALVVNIGTILVSTEYNPSAPSFFSAALGDLSSLPETGVVLGTAPTPVPLTADGPYAGDAIFVGGQGTFRFLVQDADVVVYDALTRVEFTGTDYSSGDRISGALSCI